MSAVSGERGALERRLYGGEVSTEREHGVAVRRVALALRLLVGPGADAAASEDTGAVTVVVVVPAVVVAAAATAAAGEM
jgi:hypothetical protein